MTILSKIIEEKLSEDIIVGYFKPNRKLHIKRLTQRYGSGASPVREALSRLIHTQMVIALDQRGFCTPPLNQNHLDDIILAFRSITHACAINAIKSGNAAWRQRIKDALTQLQNLCQNKQEKLNLQEKISHSAAIEVQQSCFFNELINACPSAWLLKQAMYLQQHLQRYRNILNHPHTNTVIRYSCIRQEQMAKAALNSDPELLCQLMDTYINKTHQYLSHCLANIEHDEQAYQEDIIIY